MNAKLQRKPKVRKQFRYIIPPFIYNPTKTEITPSIYETGTSMKLHLIFRIIIMFFYYSHVCSIDRGLKRCT